MTDKYKPNDWANEIVVCIASGPSLTQADVEIIKHAGVKTIVTNTTFRMVPWANIIYGFDAKWWIEYLPEIKRLSESDRVTYAPMIQDSTVKTLFEVQSFKNFGSSGVNAISLAIMSKAKKVVLVGYDCSLALGYHWHGKHPQGLSNCQSIDRWSGQHELLARYAEICGVEIINASRFTSLECYKKEEIWKALDLVEA
jgi:hypothetical protein